MLSHGVPDVVSLAGSSGRVPHPPTTQRVRAILITRTVPERYRNDFEIRAHYTDRWWGAADRPLLVSEFPDLEEKPEQIEVYSDASCVPGSSWSAIGMSCPALGVVASAVLDQEFIKDHARIQVPETAAIAADVMLFCNSARRIVIHSDYQPALHWWEDLETIPGCWSKLRSHAFHENKSHRNAEIQWGRDTPTARAVCGRTTPRVCHYTRSGETRRTPCAVRSSTTSPRNSAAFRPA